MTTEPEYLSASQAAAYLGVHRSRLYQLTKAGLGRRIGGYWLYTKAELDTYTAAPKKKGGRPKSIAPSLGRPAGAMHILQLAPKGSGIIPQHDPL